MFFKKKKAQVEPVQSAPNARKQYRKRNSKSQPLEATLRVGGWEPLRVELLDLSMHGAGLRVPFAHDRNLKVGDVIELRIGSMMRNEVATTARVANVAADGQTHIRYGVEFTNLGALYSQLDSYYARHFNRRKQLRVLPSLDKRVHATLKFGGEELRVPVFDISEGGVGVTLTKDSAARVAELGVLDIALQLPGVDKPISCRTQIRHRTPMRNNILVGLEFEVEGERAIGARMGDVLAFVKARAAEIAMWEKNWG
ncbi:MAG: PilZ domain-containing protein [Planctomycetes bacterium]|nr:PilZ domain-containing protein [Planctomycetota bacterium]